MLTACAAQFCDQQIIMATDLHTFLDSANLLGYKNALLEQGKGGNELKRIQFSWCGINSVFEIYKAIIVFYLYLKFLSTFLYYFLKAKSPT